VAKRAADDAVPRRWLHILNKCGLALYVPVTASVSRRIWWILSARLTFSIFSAARQNNACWLAAAFVGPVAPAGMAALQHLATLHAPCIFARARAALLVNAVGCWPQANGIVVLRSAIINCRPCLCCAAKTE
jgi:hypothetical protein